MGWGGGYCSLQSRRKKFSYLYLGAPQKCFGNFSKSEAVYMLIHLNIQLILNFFFLHLFFSFSLFKFVQSQVQVVKKKREKQKKKKKEKKKGEKGRKSGEFFKGLEEGSRRTRSRGRKSWRRRKRKVRGDGRLYTNWCVVEYFIVNILVLRKGDMILQ